MIDYIDLAYVVALLLLFTLVSMMFFASILLLLLRPQLQWRDYTVLAVLGAFAAFHTTHYGLHVACKLLPHIRELLKWYNGSTG